MRIGEGIECIGKSGLPTGSTDGSSEGNRGGGREVVVGELEVGGATSGAHVGIITSTTSIPCPITIYVVTEACTNGLVTGTGTISATATGETALTSPIPGQTFVAFCPSEESNTVINTLTSTGNGITLRILHPKRL